MSSLNYAEEDKKHIIHPNISLKQREEAGGIIMESGKDCMVRDITGREYIDGTTTLWLSTSVTEERSWPR